MTDNTEMHTTAATKIKIGGREFDLNNPDDAIAVQANLVPANWPTSQAENVRLFIATKEVLCFQLARHLAASWMKICKQTQEEVSEGNAGRIKIGFSFELDQSAPTVCALAKHSLSFSATTKTEGKAQTYDINQVDFDAVLESEPEIGADEPLPIDPELTPSESPAPEGQPEDNTQYTGEGETPGSETIDKPKKSRKKKSAE